MFEIDVPSTLPTYCGKNILKKSSKLNEAMLCIKGTMSSRNNSILVFATILKILMLNEKVDYKTVIECVKVSDIFIGLKKICLGVLE